MVLAVVKKYEISFVVANEEIAREIMTCNCRDFAEILREIVKHKKGKQWESRCHNVWGHICRVDRDDLADMFQILVDELSRAHSR